MENSTQTTETTQTKTPKPRSEAQIAASRLNGAKSHGPTTEEGKARSAANATRHGLLSALTVATGERSDSFVYLCADLYDTFNPIDEHERNLVDTMAMSIWRRSRCLSIETAGISHLLLKQRAAGLPPTQPALEAPYDFIFRGFVANPAEQHTLDLLHRYEARHTRAYERAVKALLAYRKSCQSNPSPSVPAIPEAFPEAFPEAIPAPLTDVIPETVTETAPEPTTETVPAPEIQPIEPKPSPALTPRTHNNHPSRTSFKKISRKNRRRK